MASIACVVRFIGAAEHIGIARGHQVGGAGTNAITMSLSKEQVLARMSECGVVPDIRAPSKELLADITRALLAGAVISIEVTMSTPDAIAGIEMLARQFGDQVLIGVGTVLKPETARDAIAAGAKFVVSPAFDLEVVAVANREKVAVIPGAFT